MIFFVKLLISIFAVIVFDIEILSLFKKINSPCLFGLILIELLLSLAFWFKNKKPLPKINFKGFFIELKKTVLEDKSFIFLIFAFFILISVSFLLAVLIPPTEPDAQSYHCLRALFWAKDGFINFFETSDIRCHIMPINSELVYTFLLVLFKNDTCFGLLEFFSFIVILITSFNIMEFFEIDFKKRIWALLIFSSFASVICQISSTQTDLVIGALLSTSFYFVLKYKQDKKPLDLFFCALAPAIGFGTKSTCFIAFLPLFIYYCFLLKKDILKYSMLLVLNFFIFSSYGYILNLITYNNPLGAQNALLIHKFWGGYKAFIGNFIRYNIQLIDFSGLQLYEYVKGYIFALQNFVLNLFHIPFDLGVSVKREVVSSRMNEMYAGIGFVGVLAFLPALFISFFNKKLRIFPIIFYAQLLILSLALSYMVFSIRFITTFVVLAIPVLSLTYFKKMNLYKFILIFYCVLYMALSSFVLTERPLALFFKKAKEFNSIEAAQDYFRSANHSTKKEKNQSLELKNAIFPLCKNNSKIGLFISAPARLYAAKYLEHNNDCGIYLLNALHTSKIKDFDYIISPFNFPQSIEVFTKDDVINPDIPNDVQCSYSIFTKNSAKNDIMYYLCTIEDDFFLKRGYEKSGSFSYDINLKGQNPQNTENYIIWSKI